MDSEPNQTISQLNFLMCLEQHTRVMFSLVHEISDLTGILGMCPAVCRQQWWYQVVKR